VTNTQTQYYQDLLQYMTHEDRDLWHTFSKDHTHASNRTYLHQLALFVLDSNIYRWRAQRTKHKLPTTLTLNKKQSVLKQIKQIHTQTQQDYIQILKGQR
jgi:hypothetical protein